MLQYVHGTTVLHRLPPLCKLGLAVLLSALCFATGNLLLLALLIGGSVALGALAGIGKQTLRTLLGLCKFSSILFLLQVFFISEGRVLLALPLGLAVTGEGIVFSARLCLRLIGATLPLTVMLAVTRLPDLTRALERTLRVPYRYAFALSTAIRFIPILARDFSAVVEAQTARGVELDGNLLQRVRLLLPLCVPLLVSSVRRIESAALSAELRGFHLRAQRREFR